MAEVEHNVVPEVDAAEAAAKASVAAAIADRLVQQHELKTGSTYPVSTGLEHQFQNEGSEGANNKRKFEEEEQPFGEGHLRKRASFNGPDGAQNGGPPGEDVYGDVGADNPGNPGPTEGPNGEYMDYDEITGSMIGKLIGRNGETIRDIQGRTNTHIQIDHKGPEERKRITIKGRKEDVEKAKQEIRDHLAPGVHETVECPPGIVGRVIGRQGETIKAFQQASDAHIVVDQNFPEGVPRKVMISGRPEAVKRAVMMITDLINGEPGSAQAIIQKYGVGITQIVDCPKGMVGRVIGKGGETVKMLQKQHSVNIQINQETDPTKVQVSGVHARVKAAVDQIKEIITGGPTMFGGPGMGGPGGFGGPGPRGPPGGGFAPQFPPQYPPGGGYGGYGGYAPQAAAPSGPFGYYGAGYPPAYAPAPAAGYGGYGSYAPAADPYAASSYGAYGQQSAGASSGGQQSGGGSGSGVWQELHDNDSGRTYYYNTQTGHSQWEKPDDFQ